MSPISAIMISNFIISALLGTYVLLIDSKDRTHRLFFALAINMALWNLFASFAFSSETIGEVWFFFRLGAVFEIVFVSMMLHFTMNITNANKGKFLIPLFYALSLPVHYRNWSSFFAFDKIERENNTWVFTPAFHSFWMQYWNIYFETILIISLIQLFKWMRHAEFKREKKQAQIIFYSFIVYVVVSVVGDYILSPMFHLPPLSPSYLIIFIVGGIWYSIYRHRFLAITHATVSRDIVENMDFLIMLFNDHMELLSANRKARELFGDHTEKLLGKKIDKLFESERENMMYFCCNEILQGIKESATCVVSLYPSYGSSLILDKTYLKKDSTPLKVAVNMIQNNIKGLPVEKNGKKMSGNKSVNMHSEFTGNVMDYTDIPVTSIVMEMHFSLVKDENDDPLGVLLVGKELFGVNRFIKHFHVTQREWETIQYMILGMTNKEIAGYMKLSTRTVKTHIAHLYAKIGIKSKIQLMNVLREFKILT